MRLVTIIHPLFFKATKFSFLKLSFVLLLLIPLSLSAQDIMDKQKVLEAHNILREEVGLEPLVWSDELAKIAEKWAKKVAKKNGQDTWVLEHSTSSDLGENIAGGWLDGDSPEVLVRQGWGEKEKEYFNPETRQCYSNQVCGHYTQIVWRKTAKVGCGIAINKNGKYILVCNYDPPGNYRGESAY